MRKLRVKASQRLEAPSHKSQDSRMQGEHGHSGHTYYLSLIETMAEGRLSPARVVRWFSEART